VNKIINAYKHANIPIWSGSLRCRGRNCTASSGIVCRWPPSSSLSVTRYWQVLFVRTTEPSWHSQRSRSSPSASHAWLPAQLAQQPNTHTYTATRTHTHTHTFSHTHALHKHTHTYTHGSNIHANTLCAGSSSQRRLLPPLSPGTQSKMRYGSWPICATTPGQVKFPVELYPGSVTTSQGFSTEDEDNERDCEMRLLVGCDLGGGCCGSCVGTVRFKQFGKKVHIKMGPNGYISMLISIDYFIHDMT
jgi:hypothetical protein